MELTDLRRAAIDLLGRSSFDTVDLLKQSPAELIHELQVHQVELEMQNRELRSTQLKLEDSRDRFSNLFDFAPVGYVTIDASGRIIEANLTIAKLLGVERGALVGQLIHQFVAADDAVQLHLHLREVDVSQHKVSCEVRIQRSDGSMLYVRLDSIAVDDGTRSVTVSDLTENARLVQANEDSDERLRVICHAMPIPIAYADRNSIYQFNNTAHEKWFGFSRQKLEGQHIRDVVGRTVHALINPQIDRVLDGQVSRCELQMTPRGGTEPRTVDVHYIPHRADSGDVTGFYELMLDLCVQRKLAMLEAKENEQKAQLDRLSVRQRAVFAMIMKGSSNKRIALDLSLSEPTVERERRQLLVSLGAESMSELLVKYAGVFEST
ncbi:MAG: PAS domain S-box protein [Planctomycetaceae bacterium]